MSIPKIKTSKVALLLSVLFTVSVFIPLISLVPVGAAPDPNITPRKYASLYNAARTLIECDDRTWGFEGSKSGEGIDSGEIFRKERAGFLVPTTDKIVHSGFLVGGSDGRTACETGGEIKNIYEAFGKSGSELLEDMGIYELEGNSVNYRLKEGDQGRRAEIINRYMRNEYGVDTSRRSTPAAQYAALINTFDKVCKGASRESGGTEITRIKSDGTDVKERYTLKTTNSQPVGFGIAADGGGDQQMQCTSIAEALNDLAPEYQRRVKALVDRDVDVDEGSNAEGGADNNPPCETTGSPLTWIICPLVNLLAETADFLFDNLIRPMLVARDIGYTDSQSGIFRVWASFRTIANILLILALIVVVFGQSIGGGMIDAYTAKKVLPRIMAVAILINISIYLVVLALDFTNVIGAGINSLVYLPFENAGEFKLQIGTGAAAAGGTGLGISAGITAFFLKGAGLAGAGAAAGAGGALTSALSFIGLFIVLPAALIMLAIFITLVIRQGIIILLVIVAPIALAAYVLPNTERFFKQWWGLLFKTLMVYPIVMIIFAIADVMAVVISGTLPLALDWLGDLIAIALLVIPLFLIPFAFKIAGGAIASLYGTLNGFGKQGTEFIKGRENDPDSLRNRTRYKMGDRWTQQRERGAKNFADTDSKWGRRVGRLMNSGNLQARRSMYNKQRGEITASQSATGDDTNIRDLFIAQATDGKWYRRMDMTMQPDGSLVAVAGKKAVYENAESGAIAHQKAMSLRGGSKSDVQEALYYEWKKTNFDPRQMDNLTSQYGQILDEHGFSEQEGVEMGKGVGFRHQGQSLVSKHSSFGRDSATGQWGMKVDPLSLAREGAFNIGTYQWSNQDVGTFKALGDGHAQMKQITDRFGEQAAGDTILTGMTGELAKYNGKSLAQIREGKSQIERIAQSTNPDQRTPGVDRLRPADEGDGAEPVGYGGVSNAPVEVQAAARELYQRIYGNNNTPPAGPPGPGQTGDGPVA